MELLIYLSVILFVLLALFHLITGVSNDAVNFLNAAIGSRVASTNVIMAVAGSGLIIGTFFSGGMMDIIRNGVINPPAFMLHELLIIIVAVALVNILLLDAFNTAGFPTSTTISLIFGLVGAALAVVLTKQNNFDLYGHHSNLINTDKILIILGGLLIAIVLAFVTGAVAQFFTRLIFSFRYQGKFNFLFSVFGALAISAISFLILKKGMTGMFGEDIYWIQSMGQVRFLIVIFIGSVFCLWGLATFLFVDIPMLVVLFGTFALALSFASNDLVNFIGLPLTGIESFKEYSNTPNAFFYNFPLQFLDSNWVNSLHYRDSFYFVFFLLAGIVMVLTLFKSKKLKSVIETEVYLGRQSTGKERFEPTELSKILVRFFLNTHKKLGTYIPGYIHNFISLRFKAIPAEVGDQDVDGVAYFDTLRASVNLLVASILISVGTYLKFPLSTTFVVFMVSMGTSFADQAWGRESAVYRLSGVLSVLGGWIITALGGFIGAFIFSLLLLWGGWPVAVFLFLLVAFILWRTTIYHNKEVEKQKELYNSFNLEKIKNIEWLRETGIERIRKLLLEVSKIYFMILDGFIKDDIRQLREASEKTILLQQDINNFKIELFSYYSQLPIEVQDSGQLFVHSLDYLSELSNTITLMVSPILRHLENQHKGLAIAQKDDLLVVLEESTAFINYIIHFEKQKRFHDIDELKNKQEIILQLLDEFRVAQIKRIRQGNGSTRVNVIYMELIAESKNILLYYYNLFQAVGEFYLKTYDTGKGSISHNGE